MVLFVKPHKFESKLTRQQTDPRHIQEHPFVEPHEIEVPNTQKESKTLLQEFSLKARLSFKRFEFETRLFLELLQFGFKARLLLQDLFKHAEFERGTVLFRSKTLQLKIWFYSKTSI